ncbi:MAG: hypothetical protein RL299_935 [Pseudomonadota bacterium]|jgi:hypothetical protein
MPSTIPLTPTPDSSQIAGYGYDTAAQRLAVAYRSNSALVTYEYKNVPPEVAAALDAAESKGSFIYKSIKPAFDFDRLMNKVADESEGGGTA